MAACPPFDLSSTHFSLLGVMCHSQMAPIPILFPVFFLLLTPCAITHSLSQAEMHNNIPLHLYNALPSSNYFHTYDVI